LHPGNRAFSVEAVEALMKADSVLAVSSAAGFGDDTADASKMRR